MAKTKQIFLEKKVKDWNDFSRVVNILDIVIPPMLGYIYRGQSKADWDLVPSFHRHFESIPLPKTEELLKIEIVASKIACIKKSPYKNNCQRFFDEMPEVNDTFFGLLKGRRFI